MGPVVILHEVHIPEPAPSVVFLGDTHIGPVNCDEDLLERTVERISEEGWWWIGMGDYADCIKMADKRFDPALLHPRFLTRLDDLAASQIEHFLKIIQPIQKKCLGLLTGNHENEIRKRYGENVMRWLCRDLGVKNLESNTLITLRTEVKTWTIYADHAGGGGGDINTKMRALKRRVIDWAADLFARGHVHALGCQEEVQLGWGGTKRIKGLHYWLVLTGTYLQTYATNTTSSYGELRAYSPTLLGSPVVTFGEEIDARILKIKR